MRPAIITALLLMALASSLPAQENSAQVRRDTMFAVDLQRTLKSSQLKVGDPVLFHTTDSTLIGHNIVVPRGAAITGSVTEVRRNSSDAPRNRLSIRLDTLRWKGNEVPVNLVVSSVTRSHFHRFAGWPVYVPTFLENYRIIAHLRQNATTDFLSDEKEVVLRSGIELVLRQIDPDQFTDVELNVAQPEKNPGRPWN